MVDEWTLMGLIDGDERKKERGKLVRGEGRPGDGTRTAGSVLRAAAVGSTIYAWSLV
jgi:hypothetical protein